MRNSTLIAFIAGAAVGAALALLHTEKGEAIKGRIKERMKEKCAMKNHYKDAANEESSDIALEHSVAADSNE